MKKFFITMLTCIFMLGMSGLSNAYPFLEVEGFVNPSSATIVDNGTTSTLTGLEYSFCVDYASNYAEMNYLSLEFEDSVFSSVSNFTIMNPLWATEILSTPSSIYTIASMAGGHAVGVGQSLKFMVDVVMNNAAFTDSSLWQEGHVWSQSWVACDTCYGVDGGSTAPVPEPATILLMGVGLAGIAGIQKKRMKGVNKNE